MREMVRKKDMGQLRGNDLRHAVYEKQLPRFEDVDRLHRFLVKRESEF